MTRQHIIDRLSRDRELPLETWAELIAERTEEDCIYAAELARSIARARFGNRIFFRGIVEFTNICKNDCLYCGIRRSNGNVCRYRLTDDEILECCREGYALGYRTFVLQGGEDAHFTDDRLCALLERIGRAHPDCAVTLSVGERSRKSYQRLFDAGARRYLLRHETADAAHYASLHPSEMSFENRMRCLYDLKEIGYQTGCGMMIGSPGQTPETLAKDMAFISEFRPAMVGMGPFLPHKDTPFRNERAGDRDLCLFLLSLVRIMLPQVLLPATTALGTVSDDGWRQGVLSGCNVIMPNLSPASVRKNYMLYDNKAGTDMTAEAGLLKMRRHMEAIGYEVITARGDHADYAAQTTPRK